jgi:hypothetical protein
MFPNPAHNGNANAVSKHFKRGCFPFWQRIIARASHQASGLDSQQGAQARLASLSHDEELFRRAPGGRAQAPRQAVIPDFRPLDTTTIFCPGSPEDGTRLPASICERGVDTRSVERRHLAHQLPDGGVGSPDILRRRTLEKRCEVCVPRGRMRQAPPCPGEAKIHGESLDGRSQSLRMEHRIRVASYQALRQPSAMCDDEQTLAGLWREQRGVRHDGADTIAAFSEGGDK